MGKVLYCLSFILFGFAGGMLYAFVFDVEPLSPDKVYSLERAAFNRSNDDWNREFPSFGEWMNEREKGEQKFRDWLCAVVHEFGCEFAASFDPSIDPWSGYYVDLREGQPAAAPDNPMRSERE